MLIIGILFLIAGAGGAAAPTLTAPEPVNGDPVEEVAPAIYEEAFSEVDEGNDVDRAFDGRSWEIAGEVVAVEQASDDFNHSGVEVWTATVGAEGSGEEDCLTEEFEFVCLSTLSLDRIDIGDRGEWAVVYEDPGVDCTFEDPFGDEEECAGYGFWIQEEEVSILPASTTVIYGVSGGILLVGLILVIVGVRGGRSGSPYDW